MQFNNLQSVLEHQFAGNHAADREAFDAIEHFCQSDEVSMNDKIKALTHQYANGMGLDIETHMVRRDVKALQLAADMRGNNFNTKRNKHERRQHQIQPEPREEDLHTHYT